MDLGGLWDSPMVSGVAFHPRQEEKPADRDGAMHGSVELDGDAQAAYSLYLPADPSSVQAVAIAFTGNAELCTDSADTAGVYHKCGCALLVFGHRGYGWARGTPALGRLSGDAERCYEKSSEILRAGGVTAEKAVLVGRSIGATCAVHLASEAKYHSTVCGLIVDSGLMSVLDLPMVAAMVGMLEQQQPGAPGMLRQACPITTLAKLRHVQCPALVMHGENDEIVPVAQGVSCHDGLVESVDKELQRWPECGHNDVLAVARGRWAEAVTGLLSKATSFDTRLVKTGQMVELHSLSAASFNGLRGKVLGRQGNRIRVGLEAGERALQYSKLRAVDAE
eukprot:TRINITY_DN3106_c0_g1_i1.p1 TRINITY_DN3106_c0_g1~~TRINITY_DN3106_c0_g1_i1.p1  ORF type:complete len:364 (+),score=125.86 TRINITY_DN3106_c0_g1_i1:87-1094(+)